MEAAYWEESMKVNSQETIESEYRAEIALQAKMAELIKAKEELARAKDSATQSWLDSRPLIDELERLQSELANTKNRTSMSNIVISELESELEATHRSIKFKMGEELKATDTTNEITRALDQTHKECETFKQDMDEESREISKLKQTLHMRRQTLRTLRLMLRAVQMESEAFGASAADALKHMNTSGQDTSVVLLTREEYYTLKQRAKDETSLAEWRISVSKEQKLTAETSRNLAASRLKEVQSEKRSRKRRTREERVIEEGHANMLTEEQDSNIRTEAIVDQGTAFPKARAKAFAASNRNNQQKRVKRSQSNKKPNLAKEKKPSIFTQIRRFLSRSFSRLFR